MGYIYFSYTFMVITQRTKDLYAQYLEEDKEITKYAMEYIAARKKNPIFPAVLATLRANQDIYMDIYNKVCQSR
jgi:uncharacterized protein YjgD (DUF1641 family)